MLKAIAESRGYKINGRYYDLINKSDKDNRSADEIVLDIIKRAGLKVEHNGSS